MGLVKIYNMLQDREVICSRGAAENKLRHNHYKNGGRFCAMNEVEFYKAPEPTPVVEELPDEPYDLPEVQIEDSDELPDESEVIDLPPVGTKQTVAPAKKRSTGRRSTKGRTAKK